MISDAMLNALINEIMCLILHNSFFANPKLPITNNVVNRIYRPLYFHNWVGKIYILKYTSGGIHLI